MPVKTDPEGGVDCENPTLVGEENETPFIRVWKPFPSKRVLKTLRKSPKGKAQRRQYLLAVDLGCYVHYIKDSPVFTPRMLN